MNDLGRFFALERRLLERLSTRVDPFEHGVAFFDEEFPSRYISNLLMIDRSIDGVPAAALLEDAERVLGGAGFGHRWVVIRDGRAGERLVPTFIDAGYAVERNRVMVHRRPPDREPDLDVEEVRFDDVRPLLLEIYRREPYVPSEDLARTFTDQHGKFERVIGARFFAVRIGGLLAGNCELYVDGSEAQVEFVDTLEEFRGRGVARAVVTRAIDEAHRAGADRVFIVADAEDWPRVLYARLGFDAIGGTCLFTRTAES